MWLLATLTCPLPACPLHEPTLLSTHTHSALGGHLCPYVYCSISPMQTPILSCPLSHLDSAASSLTDKLPLLTSAHTCSHTPTAPSVPCWHLSSLPACPLQDHALPSILSLSGLSTHLYMSLQTNVLTCPLLPLSPAGRHLHIYCPCPSLTSAVTCSHVTTVPCLCRHIPSLSHCTKMTSPDTGNHIPNTDCCPGICRNVPSHSHCYN